MYLIVFILGIICGFGGKLGADWYAEQTIAQKAMQKKLENWARTLDAMDLLKNEKIAEPKAR